MLREVDKDTFEAEVLKEEGFVLVDYFSDSCEPCKALLPGVEELSNEYDGKVKFVKLNTTKARRLAISQRVMGLPTIILYKDGEKVGEVTQADATVSNIKSVLDNNI